ncbi:COP1-interacting protein 7 [Senna tora]|uniref:COP1-interacting protein 7 n=1 Tax=Senna tora TaxID=362788 RepID=A0A834X2G6_9FABA|nr:COP1-interacting protein 7 [Senna tora]
MDFRTRLDHALFQLTPTRTRCDLVIVSGAESESLASGLLEPFLAHLKSAKDQISKGGYSIVLRPAALHAPWFTKATLQRFVRFVTTPEVLERVVTIEKEIVQIESSIQSSENGSVVAEAEGYISCTIFFVYQSTSKFSCNNFCLWLMNRVRLQRVLDNRKAVLRKEQAMAYARALVAGFDLDSVDDLISFADAFGASRLREACINFLELCKQKNEDRLWMDEIAAMQACSQPELPYLRTSGIILAGEDNDPAGRQNSLVDASVSESTPSHASFDINQDNSFPTSAQTPTTDGRAQMPMPWPNHPPQYHNFQGPVFQQMPPYQGYLYPGMQIPSPYFPGNMQWPPSVEDSRVGELDDRWNRKDSLKKKKKSSQALENSEEDASTASSNSSNESDSDDRSKYGKKKHGRKSSRKVVIRNINYITSNGDGEKGSFSEGSLSNDEEYVNGDSLKQQVEEAVVSLERRHKSTSRQHKKRDKTKLPGMLNGDAEKSNGIKGNNNWDAFQNLLLREEESTSGAEKLPSQIEEEYSGTTNFEHERSSAANLKLHKTKVVSNDSFIVTDRKLDSEDQTCIGYYKEGKVASPYVKKINSTDEEFLFSQRNEESGNYSSDVLSGCGTGSSITKRHKDEDWFTVSQSDKPANENGNKDFSMFNGVSVSSSATSCFHAGKNKKDMLADDSFIIQSRSSENQFSSQSVAHISLDSDIIGSTELANSGQASLQNMTETLNAHEPDDLFMVLERESAVEQSVAPWTMEMDYENNVSSNEVNSKLLNVETDEKQQSNCGGTGTKTSGVQTGKVSSKEAKSKAQNGSLRKTKSDVISRSKASPGSRTTVVKSKSEKEEENRKRTEEQMIQRQRRIAERSSTKKTGTGNKTSKTSAKNDKSKIHPSTEDTKKLQKPVLRNSTIERLATARVSQKVSPIPIKSGPTKKPTMKANGVPSQKNAGAEKKKLGPKEVKSSNKKNDKKNTNEEHSFDTNAQIQHDMEAAVVLPMKHSAAQPVEPNDSIVELKDITELPRISSAKNNAGHMISERKSMLEKVVQLDVDSTVPNQNRTFGGNLAKDEVLDKVSSVPSEEKPVHVTEVIINPTAASPNQNLTVSAVNSKANHESYPVSPKKSGIEISTPPPSDRVMPEPVHSRKKWNSEEDSSKAAKGFRKLLFFGRRS